MSKPLIIAGARVFDGEFWFQNAVLEIADGKVVSLTTAQVSPTGDDVLDLSGQLIVPGFIDLQVNGGGGVLLNEDQSVEGIAAICAAHAKFGTTALLPTLITDRPDIVSRTLEAGREAKLKNVPGYLGLHLEGPHLSIAKKGAHDPSLIREMTDKDANELIAAKRYMDVLLTTVAPENVSKSLVSKLSEAGITVSLGHTEASRRAYGDAPVQRNGAIWSS